jgi:HK97 family phage major capsid protein
MTRYQRLLQERAEALARGEAIVAAAEADNRDLTDEERAEHGGIVTRLRTLNADIATEEEMRENARLVAQNQPVSSVPAMRGSQITSGHDRAQDDPRGGFRNMAEFARAVRAAYNPAGGAVDDRLRYLGAPTGYFQEEGGTNAEGFLVPIEYRQTIWQIAWADDLLSRLTFEPTSAAAVGLIADETTPWGTTGVTAKWRAEGSQMTPQTFKQEPRYTRLHELYAFLLATDELLADAPLMQDRMTTKAGQAIAWKAADAILFGTGAGQPLGVMNAPALITQNKETGQAATTVVAENVLKMASRLLMQDGASAFWIANSDVLPQLPTMTIGVQPVWLSPSGLAGAPNGGMLLGKPLVFSEHPQTLGTAGDLILFNPAGYHAIRRSDAPEFASSIHLYFDYAIQAFRWTFRLGGQPYLSAAVSPARGTTTKSHFVALQTR